MSKISVKATIVANQNVVERKTPVCTRVQTKEGYEFVNSLAEVRELINENRYSIFVNFIRGTDKSAPFKKGHLCSSYKEAIQYIASQAEGSKYRIDLVLRSREYSSDELVAIATSLDF